MPRIVDNFSYRPEIDGLRAIAVLAVLFFHADLFGCTGGFIGVDIFFVISGFLITSLIWRDLENGKFSFVHFWERRARRIVPALFAVTLITLVAGWFILLPSDFESLGQAAASQAFFGANIHYWRESGYFSTAADVKPLLHTWSLAVEEQFYLFAPFIFFVVFRSNRLRKRGMVAFIILSVLVASFALSVYGVSRYRTATFFLLPTRAWELLIGSFIVFLPVPKVFKEQPLIKEICCGIALIMMLTAVFVFDRETPFPGLAAIPPCAGAALFILANGDKLSTLGKVIAIRPVVFIGLISYSLYLWHWPLLAFARYISPEPLSLNLRITLLLTGFLASVISWRFVETPFRKKSIGSSKSSVFAYASGMLVTILVLGLLILKADGFPGRYSPSRIAFAEGKNDRVVYRNLELGDIERENFEEIGIAYSKEPPVLMVWGDSFAMAALPGISSYLKEKNVRGVAALHTSTPPALGFSHAEGKGVQDDKLLYDEGILNFVAEKKIPHVMLVGCWRAYTTGDTRFENALVRTIQRIQESGAQAWILKEPPEHLCNIPRLLSQPLLSEDYVNQIIKSSQDTKGSSGISFSIRKKIEALNGVVIDPKDNFTDQTTGIYMVKMDNKSLYYDGAHLSKAGANLVIFPLLKRMDFLNIETSTTPITKDEDHEKQAK